MKKYSLVLLAIMFAFLVGCTPNLNDLQENVEDDFQNGDLANYIEEISISVGEKTETNEGDLYPVDVTANVNKEFISLTEEEIYKAAESTFMEFDDFYLDPNSFYETLMLKNEGNTYEIEFASIQNNSFEIEIDGIVYSAESFVPEETEETEEVTENGSATKEEIYEFMKLKYDEITNYGETYVPELHDLEVAELASENFNISAQEAGDIYIEMEMNQYNN
ncbi:hypothetical protein [Metabacillus litoralis]|uniref:Uncharacterized protein n=1 Tax=Metabacillus litoralis TaxID=152268 RepID=A0A179STP0_9BACI|nr:hypothetical protein [Metabacillus litoralis]OAS85097.1 hypothetical protein A6K24_06190 [Metabacillus litoralis]